MKVTAAALALLTSLAWASPLIDLEETKLSIDRSKDALDSGLVALSLTRIDDLIDETHGNAIVMEKATHVALNIQLDVQEGLVTVNDQIMPLLLPEGEGISVSIVKAETYSIPSNMPSDFYEAEHVQALADSLSLGIASLSVRLESETVPIDAVGALSADKESVAIMPVENVSMRKIGLFVTINEIEGTSFAHSKTIYAPILQLLVSAETSDGSARVKQISTLSVGGQPVAAEAIHNAADFLPDVSSLLPALEESVSDIKELPSRLWNTVPAKASGFWKALESIFGQPRYEADEILRKRPMFAESARKGLALAPNAPSFDESPYNDSQQEQSEEAESDNQSPSRHSHHHHHHKHMKGSCFWRSFKHGFLLVFAAIGIAFTQTLPGICLLGLMLGALSFHVARRVSKKIRGIAEDDSAYGSLPRYDDHSEYKEEKEILPGYQEPMRQTNLTIFDADAEVEAEK